MMNGYDMMGTMGFGPLVMATIFGLLVFLVVLVIRALLRAGSHERPTPDEILRERFARGEIDETEFRSRRIELEN